jgi:serine O-acetyltransferase
MIKQFIKGCVTSLQRVLVFPLSIPYLLTSEQELIRGDIARWTEVQSLRDRSRLSVLLSLLCNRVFRTIYLHRLKCGNTVGWFFEELLTRVYTPVPTLRIDTRDIGPGLFIQHGYGTIISAKRIGANAWVNQGVTIGYVDDTDSPIIGDNVVIAAGAKVLGPITVGDNVKIGANAVVVKNVPSNCTVVGVPAYIVRKNGIKIKERL